MADSAIDDQAVGMRQSMSGSVASAPPASSTKPTTPQKTEKQLAKEQAANRERLLHSRNPAYVINYLERKTHFDTDQIRALQRMYKRFKGSYPMDRLRFREMVASLLGIHDNLMLDRIFQAFDGDNEGSVSETEWIIGLSVQLRGSLEQQMAYAYDVYDINGDRSIGREEIASFYKNSIYAIKGVLEPEEVDDGINELVELAMRKFDLDRDGNISYSEYSHVVRRDPLLLEAFGECLPPDCAAVPTVALLDTNERSYNRYLSRPGDSGWSIERERYNKRIQSDRLHPGSIKNSKTESPGSISSPGILQQPPHPNASSKSVRVSKSNRWGAKTEKRRSSQKSKK